MKTSTDILLHFAGEARKLNGRVVFAEGDEPRTLEAAARLLKDGICVPVLVARDTKDVEHTARERNIDLSGLRLVAPSAELLGQKVRDRFIKRFVGKGYSATRAGALALDPLYFSALYVKSGNADAYVAGARSDTAEVIRSVIYGIGTVPGTRRISSFFLMIPPPGHPLVTMPVLYADCAVNPDPAAAELRDIAIGSVKSFKKLFPDERARVAFLSFSTKGSAAHPLVKKIQEAVRKTRSYFEKDPSVCVDGELQFDAAAVPDIGERKAPGSPVAGRANIFIFPGLDAGNLGYKITERYGLFKAIGPVVQGILEPASDLSRGCSVDDIFYTAIITLLQKRSGK